MTDETNTEHNEAGLLAKNRELLDELKKAKTAAREQEERANTLDARVHYWEVDKPAQDMAARVGMIPEYWLMEFNKHWKFVREGDDMKVRNLDGSPVEHTFPEGKREVRFDDADLAVFVSGGEHKDIFSRLTIGTRASGGGAGGKVSSTVPVSKPEPKNQPVMPKLGLR